MAGFVVIAAGGEVIAATPVFGVGMPPAPPLELELELLLPQPAITTAPIAHVATTSTRENRKRDVLLRPMVSPPPHRL